MKNPSSGYAEVNGAQLYYETAGQGEALVLVHAGIADSRMWDDQFEAFAEHYRVIRYDMRGFGKSNPVKGVFSHVDDLHGLLNFLNVELASFVACSMGGRTAIDLALKAPAMVKALVMVTSVPGGFKLPGDPYIPPQWEALVEADEAGDLERVNELEIQMWIDGQGRTPDQVDPVVREKVLAMNLIALQNEATGLMEEKAIEPPAAERLDELTMPLLFIIGELDDPDLVAAGHALTEKIPGAKKAIIENAAHLPNMERPAEFNQHVLAFLRG